MTWPLTTDDLLRFLRGAGLMSLTTTPVEALLDLQSALNAAVSEWSDLTKYWPFVSTGVASTVDYPTPRGRLLNLDNGAPQVVSVATAVTYTNTGGQAQVSGLNYLPGPYDAPQQGRPYTYLEFFAPTSFSFGGRVRVEALWGYCLSTAVPANALRGILSLATLGLLPQVNRAAAQGLVAWVEGDVQKKFGNPDQVTLAWDRQVQRYLRTFTRARWSR